MTEGGVGDRRSDVREAALVIQREQSDRRIREEGRDSSLTLGMTEGTIRNDRRDARNDRRDARNDKKGRWAA